MFFRIYPLDAKGHYRAPEVVDCERDEDAIAAAARLGARVKDGFHLWQLRRLVGQFQIDANGRPVPPPPSDTAPNASPGAPV